MSNIIPFESATLPAYLKQAAFDVNADIKSHAGGGFPVISIKGKQFAVVRDGERKILPNPKDPDSPATNIDVVILKVNPVKSKVFYIKGYDPKESDGKKPDCFSNDGAKPDVGSDAPQAKLCATCPHNQWGSARGEKGGKGKACQDAVRVAVATVDQLNDPYLLRIPPASIRGLGEFGSALDKRGVPYNAVVTKIAFDVEAESPKLTFKPVGFLPEPVYEEVKTMAQDEIVRNILGSVSPYEAAADAPDEGTAAIARAATVSKSKTVTADEVKEAVAAATDAPKKPAPAAKKPEPEPEVDVGDLSLDDVNFDD